MPHGTPDYWGQTPTSTTYASNDQAELAVRLGSINIFDRRGNVLWFVDTAHGLPDVAYAGDADGGTIYPVVNHSATNRIAINFHTGNVSGDYAGFIHYHYYPAISSIGIETAFTLASTMTYFEVTLNFYNGGSLSIYTFRYEYATRKLYVLINTGAYQLISTLASVYSTPTLFHSVKLVVDLLGGAYKRLLFDDHVYDLSAYTPKVSASGLGNNMSVLISTNTNANANSDVLCNGAILTQNEP
jgi:hypothetical protein